MRAVTPKVPALTTTSRSVTVAGRTVPSEGGGERGTDAAEEGRSRRGVPTRGVTADASVSAV